MENRSINVRQENQSSEVFPRRMHVPLSAQQEIHRPADEEKGIAKDSKLILKVFDKMMSVCIFMIFFGLPLFFTGMASQGVIFEKQLFFYFWILVGLIAWTARGVIAGEMRIRRTPLDIPILAFWIVTLLSTIFSVDRWHSFWGAFSDPSRGFMSITAAIVAYYIIVSNSNKKRLNLIFAAMISSGSIILVWTFLAILNIKFLPDSIAQYAPVSLSGSMMGAAIVICSLVPILTMAILKLTDNSDMKKWLKKGLISMLFLLLALNLILILALYNFVPWLALFAGVAIFLIFILSQIVRPRSNWVWLPMVVFISIMALRMVGAVPIAKINLAEVKPLDFDMSLSLAKESFKHKPILGSGPATFGYDFSMYKPKEFNSNMFYNLRFLQGTGLVLESVSTVGGLGTVLFVITILSYISVQFYLIAREKEKNKLLSLSVFSSSLIFIVSAVTTKVEGTVLLMAILTSIASLAIVMRESNSEEKFLNLSLKASPKFALALAFVFMMVSAGVAFLFVFLGKVYMADIYAAKSAKAIAQGDERGLENMSQAIRFYGQEGKYYSQLGQYYMMLANAEAMKGEDQRDVQKIRQYLNASVAATNLGKDMMKNDVGSIEAAAQIYENAGYYVPDSYVLSQENYKKALELEPHNSNFYVKIGQIDLALAASKKDEAEKKQLLLSAKENFMKAIEKKDNLAQGHFQLSIVQSALGETDEAIESNKKAVSADINNADYIINLAKLLEGRGTDNDKDDAEQLYKTLIARNDKNINAHFYLGLYYEKAKKRQEAKEEYKKVQSLLPQGNDETNKQLEKMISNVDAGIENTPQNLGLTSQSVGKENGNGESAQ